MALAIFGTGIGVSGSQWGLMRQPPRSIPPKVGHRRQLVHAVGCCGAIVGSLSARHDDGDESPFSTLLTLLHGSGCGQRGMLILLTLAVRHSDRYHAPPPPAS